jgi:hypothetical protein
MPSDNARVDAATFQNNRNESMRRTFVAGNPNHRMVPAMSKQARSAKAVTTDDPPAPDDAAYAAASPAAAPIDHAATSAAVYDALTKIDGHVKLTDAQRDDALRILRGGHDPCQMRVLVAATIALIIGILVARAR